MRKRIRPCPSAASSQQNRSISISVGFGWYDLRALLILLSLNTAFSTPARAVTASSSFPARLPPQRREKDNWGRSVWYDSGGNSDSDGEDELESSSDFEEVLPPGALPQQNPPPVRNDKPSNTPKEVTKTKESPGKGAVASDESGSPLDTLQKLQQMLDDTDYRTAASPPPAQTEAEAQPLSSQTGTISPDASLSSNKYPMAARLPAAVQSDRRRVLEIPSRKPESSPQRQPGSLWTSDDRKKYKKQQNRQRHEEILRETRRKAYEEQMMQEQARLEEGEKSDGDYGLGYVLPNLPIYVSDTEGEDEKLDMGGTDSHVVVGTPQMKNPSMTAPETIAPPNFQGQGQVQNGYTHHIHPPPTNNHNTYYQSVYGPPPPPHLVQPAPANTGQGQLTHAGYGPNVPYNPQPYYANQNPVSNMQSSSMGFPSVQPNTGTILREPVSLASATPTRTTTIGHPLQIQAFAEASTRLSFGSVRKTSWMFLSASLASYAAVSPRTLPLNEYNLKFYENLGSVALTMIAPLLTLTSVFDAKENDINKVISTLFVSYTMGHLLAFGGEVFLTTLIRLLVFRWFEPNVFRLTPDVPLPILPWVLRENRYRPKRISVFVADFGSSCVAAPIVEEYVKLKIIQWTVKLPKNFNWIRKRTAKGKMKSEVEPIQRGVGEKDFVSANSHITHMLAASIGLKLCDAGRRVLMYTKSTDANKRFYAICRGVFPIHELCGTMTALALARRDLLGINIPTWKMLLPAIVVHGMANFRGMKPIFKWNSSTPWSEMQLSPLNVPDSSTLLQLMKKSYAKLMWAIILARVFGYCVKNYYMVNRRAVKRTTTYAGNQAGFSAELATHEVLKKKQ